MTLFVYRITNGVYYKSRKDVSPGFFSIYDLIWSIDATRIYINKESEDNERKQK